ncbi:MAG: hypothetical protein L6R38_001243 [Xanthoria sp. 2 TBL-2021]|nr:MAG: hypothetical protein L6R38_001243 [Xanthoria sp. 2 TBL-2021]
MTTTNEAHLIRSNRKYAKRFDDGDLSHLPAKKYAIVTCMDCRIDAYSAFGISLGDAHVIRNAGGSARDALRSIVISEQFLQTTEVFVIKHTHCGMQGITNDLINQTVVKNLGAEALAELNGLHCNRFDWLPFADLEQGVKDDVAFLKSSKAIPKSVHVSGWVYDVETGKVKPVEK